MTLRNNSFVDYLKVLLYTFVYFIAFAIFQFSFFSLFKSINEKFIQFSYLFASIVLFFIVYLYYKNPSLKLNKVDSKIKYYLILIVFTVVFNRLNFYLWKFILGTESPIKIIDFEWIKELTLIISTIFIIPAVEEFFFRGIILDRLLIKSSKNIFPVIFTSLLFCSIHLESFDVFGIYTILSTFTFSIVVSILYAKFRNIFYVVWVHLIYNLIWYIFRFI